MVQSESNRNLSSASPIIGNKRKSVTKESDDLDRDKDGDKVVSKEDDLVSVEKESKVKH